MGSDLLSTLTLIIVIFTIVVNIILGMSVYRSDYSSLTNRIFALLSVLISAWMVVMQASLQPSSSEIGLFLIRLSFFLSTPMNMFFLLFVNSLPQKNFQAAKKHIYPLLIITAITMSVVISPVAVISVDVTEGFASPVVGPGIAIFALFTILTTSVTGFLLIKRTRNSRGAERGQYMTMATGFGLMYGLLIFTVLIPVIGFRNNQFVPFFPFYTLIFVGFSAYAIIKHGLFNLKILATQAITVVIWTVLFAKLLITESRLDLTVDAIILIIIIVAGVLLIKSVQREVEQREKLEELTNRLRAANERLKELDLIKDELVSVASHELRTPMTAIKGYLWMALNKQGAEINPNVKYYLQRSYDSVEQLIELVNDLLSASRLEGNRVKLKKTPLNVLEFIGEVIEDMMPKALEENLVLEIEKPAKYIPKIMADEVRLKEILINLISNALKYTDKGRVWLTVSEIMEDKKTGRQPAIQIAVHDTGKGIPEQDKPRIFQKFARLQQGSFVRSSEEGGTGLGLYITKGLVELHGGSIWFESTPGKGTTFFFTIPQA